MNQCRNNHKEVRFEGKNCPVCEKIDEAVELEKTIKSLLEQIANLEENSFCGNGES